MIYRANYNKKLNMITVRFIARISLEIIQDFDGGVQIEFDLRSLNLSRYGRWLFSY